MCDAIKFTHINSVMELKSTVKTGWKKFWIDVKSYFNVAEDLEPQLDAEQSIRSGVSFKYSLYS